MCFMYVSNEQFLFVKFLADKCIKKNIVKLINSEGFWGLGVFWGYVEVKINCDIFIITWVNTTFRSVH